MGALLVQSHVRWRWAAWPSLILGAVVSIFGFFIIWETELSVLEQGYAQCLRIEKEQWALHSWMGESSVSFRDLAVSYLTRPMAMLCLETILFLMIMYGSVFVLVYLLFLVSLKFEWNADNQSQCLPDKLCPVTRLFTDRR